MSIIQKPSNHALNPMSKTEVPSMELPGFRFLLSQERRTTKNVLIYSPYALGDCVCAEPAIRFAVKNFAGCKVSLLTPFPDLYRHIPFEQVFHTSAPKPDWDNYYVLKCYYAADELQSEFVHNFNMSIDDYIATCLFKGQVPVADRNIILQPSQLEMGSVPKMPVVIHAGKHWVSKTFPKLWWDAVISGLIEAGVQPTLIGANSDGGSRGYVDVDATHCHDFRDKLTIMQSVALLQKAQVCLSNDSAPYHMAASGSAHVGVFSTVRHFDFIGHWRPDDAGKNVWCHRTEDLALGCMWNRQDTSPARNGAKYDVIDYDTLLSWLPTPASVVEWTLAKLDRAKVNRRLSPLLTSVVNLVDGRA